MLVNTLDFLLTVVNRFEAVRVPVWVFGGWAEELWQMTPARQHNDIDFLYSEESFAHLDSFLVQSKDLQEIKAKRFTHKRAILVQGVMIEFLLVQQCEGTYFTDFFSGRYHLQWPADVFSHTLETRKYDIQIASKEALRNYRQQHLQVEQAYQDFLARV